MGNGVMVQIYIVQFAGADLMRRTGRSASCQARLFLKENHVVFFRMTEEVQREVVSLVAVLKLLIISEAIVKYPHHHLLINQTISI